MSAASPLDVHKAPFSPVAAGTTSDLPSPDAEEFAVLRAVLEGTARVTGDEFFQRLMVQLSQAVGSKYGFVAEFADSRSRVRTLAYCAKGRIEPNFEFDLAGTPCEDVVTGRLCHYPTRLADYFPGDFDSIDRGIDSYFGVPLVDAAGDVMGHLAVFHDAPLPREPRLLYLFHIFAARAAAELERLRAERRLAESEARFRDLYEQAPTAYVTVSPDGRLATANGRAAEMLGVGETELTGRKLAEFVNPPSARRPFEEKVLKPALGGRELSARDVELRRADGSPLWVDLWMRPMRSPAGAVASVRVLWIDVTERVLVGRDKAALRQQNEYLREEIRSDHPFDEIVGGSAPLRAVLENVRRVAPTDATVLITGETGTGKELIARAIHAHSRRKERPLIKLNCAALPDNLVESELFGHEKGAFTGAVARRPGRFELAEGGTVFLDEVGELPLGAQAKLLRVLQEREFERVGGTATVKADVRVIAATNRDLRAMTREGTFREDLYYRLNVFPIALPPLRERAEDIPPLVASLLRRFAQRIGKRIERVEDEALGRLARYPWPGNVRELENVLERAVILSRGDTLEVSPDLLAVPAAVTEPPAAAGDLVSVEREHIRAVLDRTGWVIEGANGAARVLGLHPNTLRSRMKRLGLARQAATDALPAAP